MWVLLQWVNCAEIVITPRTKTAVNRHRDLLALRRYWACLLVTVAVRGRQRLYSAARNEFSTPSVTHVRLRLSRLLCADVVVSDLLIKPNVSHRLSRWNTVGNTRGCYASPADARQTGYRDWQSRVGAWRHANSHLPQRRPAAAVGVEK